MIERKGTKSSAMSDGDVRRQTLDKARTATSVSWQPQTSETLAVASEEASMARLEKPRIEAGPRSWERLARSDVELTGTCHIVLWTSWGDRYGDHRPEEN